MRGNEARPKQGGEASFPAQSKLGNQLSSSETRHTDTLATQVSGNVMVETSAEHTDQPIRTVSRKQSVQKLVAESSLLWPLLRITCLFSLAVS